MKKILAVFLATIMVFVTYCMPVFAENDGYSVQLYSQVTDASAKVAKARIYLDEGQTPINIDKDTFDVKVTIKVNIGANAGKVYGTYEDINRTIVGVSSGDGYIDVYFDLDEGQGTVLTWLSEARNYPGILKYTVTQNKEFQVKTNGDSKTVPVSTTYKVIEDDNGSAKLVDEEADQFKSVIVKNGVNYQYYDQNKGDSLIIWFHGNGEGDVCESQNNIVQLLGNRGAVAFATDEAQSIFGGADVMAFQAPDTWFKAEQDNLLETVYNEIQDVVNKKGINPEKIYVAGCSAGGYMTTRMLINYPNLFKAAMINCPAIKLDLLSDRGANPPTNEEIATLKNSKTAIWLVQSEADSSVATEECAKRMFDVLTEGQELITTRVDQEIQSGFLTQETVDGKYKLSLYDNDTTDPTKLRFAEDYDQDGISTLVTYSNHWSWIYTLRNNPSDASGSHIWQWAANYSATKENDQVNNPTDTVNKENTKEESVKTGDDSHIYVYGLLMITACWLFIKKLNINKL